MSYLWHKNHNHTEIRVFKSIFYYLIFFIAFKQSFIGTAYHVPVNSVIFGSRIPVQKWRHRKNEIFGASSPLVTICHYFGLPLFPPGQRCKRWQTIKIMWKLRKYRWFYGDVITCQHSLPPLSPLVTNLSGPLPPPPGDVIFEWPLA